jgi:hypothetical protein
MLKHQIEAGCLISSRRQLFTMGKTFIALYEDPSVLGTVRKELEEAGFTHHEIKMFRPSDFDDVPDIGPDMLGISTAAKPDIGDYEEAVRRGHGMIAVTAALDKIDAAEPILAKHTVEDVDELVKQWKVSESTKDPGRREGPRSGVFDRTVSQSGRKRGRGGVRFFVW